MQVSMTFMEYSIVVPTVQIAWVCEIHSILFQYRLGLHSASKPSYQGLHTTIVWFFWKFLPNNQLSSELSRNTYKEQKFGCCILNIKNLVVNLNWNWLGESDLKEMVHNIFETTTLLAL
jgi:hypothetical protein